MDEQTRIPDRMPDPAPKRLIRSSDNRMLLGVCGGLGDYFDVDATLVRVVFAVGALAFGSTLLVYVVLAFIMPSPDMAESHPREAARGTLDETVDEVRSGVAWVRDHSPFGKKKDTGPTVTTTTTSTTTEPKDTEPPVV